MDHSHMQHRRQRPPCGPQPPVGEQTSERAAGLTPGIEAVEELFQHQHSEARRAGQRQVLVTLDQAIGCNLMMPVPAMSAHMRESMRRTLRRRGGRPIVSSSIDSTPMSSAGPASEMRWIQRICAASGGSTSSLPVLPRP
jgi:hypothetical protein